MEEQAELRGLQHAALGGDGGEGGRGLGGGGGEDGVRLASLRRQQEAGELTADEQEVLRDLEARERRGAELQQRQRAGELTVEEQAELRGLQDAALGDSRTSGAQGAVAVRFPSKEERQKRREGHKTRHAAVQIQAASRARTSCVDFKDKKAGAVRIQARARGRSVEYDYNAKKQSIVTLQAHARRRNDEQKVEELRSQKNREAQLANLQQGGLDLLDREKDIARRSRPLKPNLDQPPRYLLPKAAPSSKLTVRQAVALGDISPRALYEQMSKGAIFKPPRAYDGLPDLRNLPLPDPHVPSYAACVIWGPWDVPIAAKVTVPPATRLVLPLPMVPVNQVHKEVHRRPQPIVNPPFPPEGDVPLLPPSLAPLSRSPRAAALKRVSQQALGERNTVTLPAPPPPRQRFADVDVSTGLGQSELARGLRRRGVGSQKASVVLPAIVHWKPLVA